MNTKNYSRKISLLVAVFILLAGVFLGGYLVLKSGRVSAGQLDDILKGNSFDPKSCSPDVGDTNKDSDNDGLKDWQEIQLYKTDPCKQDTDGDGYLDGEEVASGYDPAKKAPGDELPGTLPKGPRPLPANLTNALSSMLAQQIAAGKIDSFNQNGQILSASELEKYPAIQQSVQQILSAGDQLFAPDPIDDNQIKTTKDTSKNAIIKYANDASLSFAVNDSFNQSQAFLKAVGENDFSLSDPQLEQYQKTYAQIISLTVPINLIELHKEQLNILSQFIKIYQGIKEVNNDPLKTIMAIQSLQATIDRLNNWIADLSQFINTNYSGK